MMEIIENVSDWVKKVENISSGSIPILLKLGELVGAVASSTPAGPGSTPIQTPNQNPSFTKF